MLIKNILFTIFIAILLLTESCDEPEYNIVLENNTSFDVYCTFSTAYPDTGINYISESRLKSDPNAYVRAHDTKSISSIALCDEDIWNEYVKKDTLILFVFNKFFIDEFNWKTVVDNYYVYKRFHIGYKELKNNKCKIVLY